MTEIAWIVKLMTKFKLPEDAKDECIARIGEVEEKINNPVTLPVMMPYHQPNPTVIGPGTLQPPSTLAKLAEQAQAQQPHSMTLALQRNITPVEVSTGNGTRGPRKF